MNEYINLNLEKTCLRVKEKNYQKSGMEIII